MRTAAAMIVLGGGEGRRLGGVSKPDLVLGGRRLLDLVLDAGSGCAPRVVVAPDSVEVPSGVLRTLEDPPAGGPVAGIAAGLALLRAHEEEQSGRDPEAGEPEDGAADGPNDVLVVACDLPGAAGFIGPLQAARAEQVGHRNPGGPDGPTGSEEAAGEAGADVRTDAHAACDGVIAAHADGRRELLAVLADRAALDASIREGGARDRSVRSLLAPLSLEPVVVPEVAMEDVDTWEQHAAWERRAL
ncbi:molybdenum cofactor guanylyltransferase [Brachybacterium sp. ACRRE]|uniref:molybdenum cofactor guanylyltransferase n=1 Tax=Brachybacterium sp. ACRRE TaxID=2918184 RepID=UPI001EF2ACB8|nr:NTP transferase domain-containing protein [Brachybacterium sp. ACRRE]MCG7308570.1 NTP transferase domain-containing protein [Brachybacterium sp. ACRRE]